MKPLIKWDRIQDIEKNSCITFLYFLSSIMSTTTKTQTDTQWYEVLPRLSWSEFNLIDTHQSGFEVYPLNENTYAIYELYQCQKRSIIYAGLFQVLSVY